MFPTEDMPSRIRKLRRDPVGRPIPWFVFGDDFRIADVTKMARAHKLKLCWVCGTPLGANLSFVLGPMCAVNRVSSEPPSHHDCAAYSATHCPFLINPQKGRRDGNLPEGHEVPGGIMITRNPGVTLVWNCRGYNLERVDNGVLFRVGEPSQPLEWYAEGRTATYAEIMHAIETGLPALMGAAAEDGPDGVRALNRDLAVALSLVPDA